MKPYLTLSIKLCFAFLLFPALITTSQQPLISSSSDFRINNTATDLAKGGDVIINKKKNNLSSPAQSITAISKTSSVLADSPYFRIDSTEYYSPYKTWPLMDAILMDINSDGFLDVIATQTKWTTFEETPVHALVNDGKGKFNDKTLEVFNKGFAYIITTAAMLVADFNGDKLDDAYIADNGPDASWGKGNPNTLLIQTPGGHLEKQSERLPYSKQWTYYATCADIDNDGDVDIYDSNVSGADNEKTVLLINDGNGYFSEQNQRMPQDVVTMQHKFQCSLFVDIDKDGDKDLILGRGGPDPKTRFERDVILLNDGNGNFHYAPDNSMPVRKGGLDWGSIEIISGDFNGDGWPDLVMKMLDNSTPQNFMITLLLNNRDGTFYYPDNAVISNNITLKISTADINSDGWLDLLISCDNVVPYYASFLMNSGNAIFVDKTNELGLAGKHFAPVLPGDIDNDGDIDFFSICKLGNWYYSAYNLRPYDMGITHLIKPGKPSIDFPRDQVHVAKSSTFIWQPNGINGSYQIQVATDFAFSHLLYDRKDITAMDSIKVNLKEFGSFYWRLRGTNTAGTGEWSDTAIFTAENQPPVNITLSNTTATALVGIGTTIGIFTTEDPDLLDSHSYAFAPGNGINDVDNAKFSISGDTLKTKSILNTSLKSEFHINVVSKDLEGAQVTKAFIITIEPDGLIAYYPFNGNANDESGNNHNGTPTSVTLTTDQYGNANSSYSFNGTNSKILIGNHLGLLQSAKAFTITAWVYLDELEYGPQYTVIAERDGGENYQFVIIDKKIRFDFLSGGIAYAFPSSNELTLNKWYFIGATYDGTTVNIYQEGLLDRSYQATGAIDNNPANLLIGQIYNNSAVFKGKLDEITIYNKVLSPEKIKSLYSCSASRGGKINGGTTICQKTSSGVLTLGGNVGNVIEWQKKSGSGSWVSIPSTSQTYSEIPGPAGTYYYRTVTQSGTCDIKYSEPDTITVKAVELGISQANNVLTANATPSTYQWINCATHTSIGGQTSQSYTATVNGSYAVKITQNGCTDTSACVSLINPFPESGGTISGTATVCQGQNSVTYTIPVIANATSYLWTLPSGATGTSTTNSITLNYGVSAVSGAVTVKGHNATGDGAASTLAITVNPLPESAGVISGAAAVCQGQNSVSYTVPEITNAISYIWTLPTGTTETTEASPTNSISLDYGASSQSGNITVKGHNECGDGVVSSLAVTVNPKPVTPVVTLNGNLLHSNASAGNQWYKQNLAISGAAGQDYTFSVVGDYYVIVTLNGCASEPSVTNVVTGLDPLDFSNKIVVYPNPVTNELIIEYEGNIEKTDFVIVNSTGQIVFAGFLFEKTEIETENFTPGLYFIKLRSGKTIEFRKVIKIR